MYLIMIMIISFGKVVARPIEIVKQLKVKDNLVIPCDTQEWHSGKENKSLALFG